jgi:sulfate/thiosulfate transport system permease protein
MRGEPRTSWWVVGAAAVALLSIVGVPLVAVFVQALQAGLPALWAAVSHPDTLAALRLTLLALVLAVLINGVFGVAVAWAVTRFDFPGKALLITLVDLPFTVSPVVSGLLFVLLFGGRGVLGPWLSELGVQVVYAVPGIVLATLFVTFPFVARELIPLMEEQGDEEEQAAVTLGAGGWATLLRVTLPKIKWGLLYGGILCAARAAGEFGAVSVVSGHVRGETNTLPLHVEILYNEYDFSGAFAVASLLATFGVLSIAVRKWVEHRSSERLAHAH